MAEFTVNPTEDEVLKPLTRAARQLGADAAGEQREPLCDLGPRVIAANVA